MALLAASRSRSVAGSRSGVRHPHVGAAGQMIVEQNLPWILPLGISYHLAMDGLSLLLIVLTALLGVVSVACSWREITDRVGLFHLALMVLLLAGIIGVFLAFDLFLFYFFWELMLVPMYFLIGLWGHENRIYAAIKFFLFTFIERVADAGGDHRALYPARARDRRLHFRLSRAAGNGDVAGSPSG